mmetsp:Transcript_46601/g.92023  ORF Transcript_46601/g.92023 Transcript_46601/m.92023 type:complete len:122 (-) Transcript_46601:1565-1930(-)
MEVQHMYRIDFILPPSLFDPPICPAGRVSLQIEDRDCRLRGGKEERERERETAGTRKQKVKHRQTNRQRGRETNSHEVPEGNEGTSRKEERKERRNKEISGSDKAGRDKGSKKGIKKESKK